MNVRQWFSSGGLARRFALGAAGLAAAALIITALSSWWLIERQQQAALRELATREREFHAAALASTFRAVAERMAEVGTSTILATGLVDSAGRETYLTPFLAGIRQVNGVPVQVLFTDFEGKEIGSNGLASFNEQELEWLKKALEAGQPAAVIVGTGAASALVALEPLRYARTASPEGGLLYKLMLADVVGATPVALGWGPSEGTGEGWTRLAVPAAFEPLALRVRATSEPSMSRSGGGAYFLAVALITLVIFSIVVLAGARLAKILTRDLRTLEAFSSGVVASGLTSERAAVAGSMEVASLAASINRMLDRLHEQHAELLEADRAKNEFLATLAHELRNPLAPIANSVALMRVAGDNAELVRQAIAITERQLAHLVRLVDDLLDVGRITRGRLELRKEQVKLDSIVHQALETSRGQLEAGRHELSLSLPSEPIELHADPVRIVQVIGNLLNNAAKYTDPGGRITLHVESTVQHAVIKVRDTGIGIAREMLPRIFDLFSRGDQSLERSRGGLGIGLTLAKRLVEMHDGTIEARSEGPGRGSEFIVRLPKAPQCEAAVAATAAPAPAGAGAPAAGRRVLVVDDNEDAARSLSTLLELQGNDVRLAYDGEQALAAAAEYAPEVILLDIGMPKLNGYEVCRRLRNAGSRAFVIALTGWGQHEDRQRTREAGFDAHLVKPADQRRLAELLSAAP